MKIILAILMLLIAIPVWAQSALETQATAMAPGTWHKMTGVTGPPSDMTTLGSSDGILPFSSKMVWDSTHHIGLYYAGAHVYPDLHPECDSGYPEYDPAACGEVAYRLVKYDEATNTWAYTKDLIRDKYSNLHLTGHGDGNNAMDPATGDFYRRGNAQHYFGVFDYTNQTWTQLAAPTTLSGGFADSGIDSIAWFPEASGIVMPVGYQGFTLFWDKASNTWSNLGSTPAGGELNVSIYNPIQHNMLIGGGHTSYGDCTKFYILSYSSSTFHISTAHTIPAISGHTIEGTRQICFDSDGQSGMLLSIDPVTGHYIGLASNGAGTEYWTYDINIPDPDTPASDSWTLLTGDAAWPDKLYVNGNSTAAGYVDVTPIPEYGVIMYFAETVNDGHPVETWLYKNTGIFENKCAQTGVIACKDFNSSSDLRYHWGTIDNGDGEEAWMHLCDDALTGHTNYSYDFVNTTPFANALAAIGPDSTCSYPTIDTSIKHSGAGSIKFPVPNHSTQAAGGAFSEPLDRHMDGTFGYIGPNAGGGTTNGAHYISDEVWVQFYYRVDSTMLSTRFNILAFEGQAFSTSGAGATTITIDHDTCFTDDGGMNYPYAIHDTYQRTWPNFPSLTPVYDDVNTVGRTIRFLWGVNFITNQNFTIESLTADGPTMTTHCSAVLDSSPTPSGAGGISPGGGHNPLPGDGFISGTSQAEGQKGVALFGDTSVLTHQSPTSQIFNHHHQLGIPLSYFYNQAGSISAYSSQNALTGCDPIYPEIFENAALLLTEPPCIQFHPDEWQEHTIHIKLITPGPHNIYESWIDGVKVQDRSDYDVDFQENGASNGFGAYFIEPYHTSKDPNQSHADTAVWYDDFIISKNAISMRNGTAPTPPTPPDDTSHFKVRR